MKGASGYMDNNNTNGLVEPRELLNVLSDAATEIINEHSEFSEQVLLVTKMLLHRVKDKLFVLEMTNKGLTKEEVEAFLNKENMN